VAEPVDLSTIEVEKKARRKKRVVEGAEEAAAPAPEKAEKKPARP
jgi:hypothetical protein